MRLIDADTLEEKLKDYLKNKIDNHSYEIDVTDCNVELQALLKSMPTAYDIDRVIEQFTKDKNKYERLIAYESKNGTILEQYQCRKAVEILEEAIETVKDGGVNEK